MPFVPDSVGPIEEEGHNVEVCDFIDAPTATTFLPFGHDLYDAHHGWSYLSQVCFARYHYRKTLTEKVRS